MDNRIAVFLFRGVDLLVKPGSFNVIALFVINRYFLEQSALNHGFEVGIDSRFADSEFGDKVARRKR